MALKLAILVDSVSPWEDRLTGSIESVNRALDGIVLEPNYNMMISIAGRHYVFSSDESGKVQVTMPESGAPWAQALCRAQARVVVEADVLKKAWTRETDANLAQDMWVRRKFRCEGNNELWTSFTDAISPHLDGIESRLRSEVLRAAERDQEKYEEIIRGVTAEEEEAWATDLAIASSEQWFEDDKWLFPRVQSMWGWVMMSAFGTMLGNVGQSNYNAANAYMESLTFQWRMFKQPEMMPITIMWGMIVGLGMRQKAFGSQDFALSAANVDASTMNWEEAKACLWYITVGFCPEWIGMAAFDKDMRTMLTNLGRNEFPWGRTKGKGGGLSFDDDEDSLEELQATHNGEKNQMDEPTEPHAGLRVRLYGLTKVPEVNGAKGTLIEEAHDGKWQVRLDDHDGGDKLVKVENLKTLTGARVAKKPETIHFNSVLDNFRHGPAAAPEQEIKAIPPAPEKEAPTPAPKIQAAKPAVSAPPPEFSLAGTWTDWMPQNMEWDQEKECATMEVTIQQAGSMRFGVNRGKAGTKKWVHKIKTWPLGNQCGVYRINVFFKTSGAVDQVDVKHVANAAR